MKTRQFYDHIMQKVGNSGKSTNNPMSSFGLVEEDMGLSHIHIAVLEILMGCRFEISPV